MYTARNTAQGDALLVQYALSRAPDIRDRIVEAYLYIAEIVARKFSGRGVDYDDLYQVAALALVKGIERFDADKGIKFASFITPTMVGEVKNYFRDRSRIIRLPRRSAQLARELRENRAILEQELGRSPTVDELAERMGISEDDVLEALEMSNAMTPASLDAQVADEDSETSLSTFLGFNDPGYSDFERNDMLDRALSTLDARQRAVIIARFYEGLSQRDVAAQLNISQMTVSRIERQALEKLRERMTEQE
jgi:RNA polymerase sigma-B factor